MTDVTALAADDARLADAAGEWHSAYVHIPFCRRRCPYCDFAVVARNEVDTDVAEVYIDAVLGEIDMETPFRPLRAVNFGGGTPTQSPPRSLGRILKRLRDKFGFTADVEVSLEANPEDWSDSLAEELVEAGFTRVSLGAQSFDPAVLASLGRLHSPEDTGTAVHSAREAGFGSINLDLIYGTPGESQESWAVSVDAALDLEIDHLSTYALTVELGTTLAEDIAKGAAVPDPDDQADKFEVVCGKAEAAGLRRYEVSNFAKRGHHCRYNLATWGQAEFVAFGLGAHDHRDGVRARNHRRLDRYLEAVAAGERPRIGADMRDDWGREQERVMLGLRRAAGVDGGAVGSALLRSQHGQRLLAAGVIEQRETRIVVERPLLTDAVLRDVLSLSP